MKNLQITYLDSRQLESDDIRDVIEDLTILEKTLMKVRNKYKDRNLDPIIQNISNAIDDLELADPINRKDYGNFLVESNTSLNLGE